MHLRIWRLNALSARAPHGFLALNFTLSIREDSNASINGSSFLAQLYRRSHHFLFGRRSAEFRHFGGGQRESNHDPGPRTEGGQPPPSSPVSVLPGRTQGP